MTSNSKVTLVGAGLVGSLMAVLLARRGMKVTMLERRGDMRKQRMSAGRSINLAMSKRGWTALERAGIDHVIRKEAIPMKGRIMHSETGDLTFQPYGLEDQAIYSVSRGGLNMTLLDLAEQAGGVDLRFDAQCLDVDLDTAATEFHDPNTDTTFTVDGDVVLGSDGAFSAVRGRMMKTDRFDYSQTYLKHGYKELSIPPTADGGFRLEAKALHIWPRGNFMMIALPNPDGSFTCTLFLPFEGKESFDSLREDNDVLRFFESTFGDAVPLMPTLLEDFRNNPTSSLVTVRSNPWQRNGRVGLLGDAAHAVVPFYGQGMNCGFEDCVVLDQKLDEFNNDWAAALPAYSDARIANGNAIADLALKNFIEMRDLVADERFLLRKKIERKIQTLYPDRFLPVYSIVSFSNIAYAEAMRESRNQDELLAELMRRDDIEAVWDSAEFETVIHDHMRGYTGVAAPR